ncbi:hypothetical protein DH2020_019607 [Rehmannia glutinosa]|uniref:Urease accessory protein D n=1 Tax=Rehmannia glutinosa TaxID=99300 RepID=A0ABR0WRL3_REHGL
MDRGKLVVERIGGKSTLTRCLFKYPFKFINPNKGDSIAFDVTVGDGCTAVLTTQSSTKVYKSIGSKCSKQMLEKLSLRRGARPANIALFGLEKAQGLEPWASVGRDALLVVIPDPVTCFSTAKYSQVQIFKVVPESSLLVVDWITSGRHESGEKWAFSHYKSTNRILLEGDEPVFLDTILLEQGSHISISDRLQDYQAIAMIVLLGTFGPKGIGVVVRVASMTTESVYNFLQHQLATMEALLGASPYR